MIIKTMMKTVKQHLLLLVLSLLLHRTIGLKSAKENNDLKNREKFYVAGAIAYSPSNFENGTSKDYIDKNLDNYLELIDEAKAKDVDILVFPEATLNYYEDNGRVELLGNAITVPDPSERIAPWNVPDSDKILKTLSAKAKDTKMYIVVNLVEKVDCKTSNDVCKHPRKQHFDGYDLFNTNIVFDRNGEIISKYRKYNLFLEPNVDEPLTVELATFTTDFNVKFGHFICFDIMFKDPAMSILQKENVQNILYPTFWFSDLPFITSEQFHQGWAFTNNINIIVSGGNVPKQSTSGSGIYIGRQQIATISLSPISEVKKLLTALVPKNPSIIVPNQNEYKEKFTPIEMESFVTTEYWTDLNIKTYDIHDGKTQEICTENQNLCCKFDIKLIENQIPDNKIGYQYKLVANYTKRLYSTDRELGEFYCSIISCKDENSCGTRFPNNNKNLYNAIKFDKIKIRARLIVNDTSDILAFPTTLDTSILPLDLNQYNYKELTGSDQAGKIHQDFIIESKTNLKNLLAFGIYGRDFNVDQFIETDTPKVPIIGTQN